MSEETDYDKAIKAVSAKYDADVIAYFGDIERNHDSYLVKQCHKRRLRKNALLILTTRGGDPNAAYRIARAIQTAYKTIKVDGAKDAKHEKEGNFYLYINNICKSAGTIIALGADKLFLSESAELGPIDIQLRKQEEVGERTSSLTPIQAIQFLETQSLSLFKRHFTHLRFSDDLAFSTKMAAEIATNITVGLLTPIYQQIDPIRLAEVDRFLKIASEYGKRLAKNNVNDGTLERLLAQYPSHGFVIDRLEARDLFKTVERPCAELAEFGKLFDRVSSYALENDKPFVYFLTDEPPEAAAPAAPEPTNDGETPGGQA